LVRMAKVITAAVVPRHGLGCQGKR